MQSMELVELNVAVVVPDERVREHIILPRLAEYGHTLRSMATMIELDCVLDGWMPDIVVMDAGLTDAGGRTMAPAVRTRLPRVGIVLLNVGNGAVAQIRSLREGADACLGQPLEPGLLAATIHSLGRRLSSIGNVRPTAVWRLEAGGWRLVAPCGGRLALTRSEHRLLGCLLLRMGAVVSREELIGQLTSDVLAFDPHRLESLVYRLRRKVAAACRTPLPIAAVQGEGYVFAG